MNKKFISLNNKKILEYDSITDFRNLLTNEAIEELLKDAQLALEGRLILPGTDAKPFFVGDPPKWEENPVEVGGYTWTLSRLKYMQTLCKAYILTKDEKYMKKVVSDLENWLETVTPPPVPTDSKSAEVYHGLHNWRMLELGYRMVYTFPILLDTLIEYNASASLMEKVKLCIQQHGERIAAGSHLLWPNADHNHYLEEVTGLMAAAALIPKYEMSPLWAKQAMKALVRCCEVQITDDGGQIEGCPLYHNACIKNLLKGLLFAQSFGIEFPKEYIERLKTSLDYSVHSFRPNGTAVPLGDTDPETRSVDSAIYGYLLFEESKWLEGVLNYISTTQIHRIISKITWGFPNVDKLINFVNNFTANEHTKDFELVNYQRELDQVFIRTSWDRDALYLAFICKSPIHYGAHAHIDPLSFDFTAYGKVLLADPGRYTYKDGEERHMIKSSEMHNMPTIGGRDAFEYISTFVYGHQEEGGILEVFNTPNLKGARGYHLNYKPSRLERTIAIIEDSILLIVDNFKGAKGENAEVYFNINSLTVSAAEGKVSTCDEDVNLVVASTMSEVKLVEGIISDKFNHSVPSTRAVFTQKLQSDNLTFATVVVPQRGALTQEVPEISMEDGSVLLTLREKHYVFDYSKGTLEVNLCK